MDEREAADAAGKVVAEMRRLLQIPSADPPLLIDADLRRSQVAKVLGFRSTPGLSELLTAECELSQAVRRFRSTQLAVIPAGATPEEPTQLLASRRMRELLEAVRDNFDEVYVDLPPTLPFADASILGAQLDGVLMVIRANVTSSKQASQALESLAGAQVVGCVLNAADGSAAPYVKAYR